jgi:hypothetical protein
MPVQLHRSALRQLARQVSAVAVLVLLLRAQEAAPIQARQPSTAVPVASVLRMVVQAVVVLLLDRMVQAARALETPLVVLAAVALTAALMHRLQALA